MTKISVVSPSFNQAAYVGATLDSIAAQTFPDFEHIIFDGGSNDGTADLVRAYAKRQKNVALTIGPDKGQGDAINKGFRAAKGEIVTWLNTDDRYSAPNVLQTIVAAFERYPQADVVYGRGAFVDPTVPKFVMHSFMRMQTSWTCPGIVGGSNS